MAWSKMDLNQFSKQLARGFDEDEETTPSLQQLYSRSEGGQAAWANEDVKSQLTVYKEASKSKADFGIQGSKSGVVQAQSSKLDSKATVQSSRVFRDSLSGSSTSSSSTTSIEDPLEENSDAEKKTENHGHARGHRQHEHHIKRGQSVQTFLKERILYHGPEPYLDDYKEEKAKYEIPIKKPKKRIRNVEEEVTITPVKIKAVGSDDSEISTEAEEKELEFKFDNTIMMPCHCLTPAALINEELLREEAIQLAAALKKKKSIEVIRQRRSLHPTESQISITEKICNLKNESRLPFSLRDMYVGVRTVKGYPKCADRTVGRPQCLSPGELVRKAIRTDVLWGIPEYTPLDKDVLIELMRRIEKYPTSDYVFLSYVKSMADPDFNPYCFQIIKWKDVNLKQYFTLSKYGILYFTTNFAEHISLFELEKQIHMYYRVKMITFFVQYRLWKAFFLWRYNVRHSKIITNKKLLEEKLFWTKRPLRMMMLEMNKISEKVAQMGFLSVRTMSNLKDFLSSQDTRMGGIRSRLESYQKIITEMCLAACRSALLDAGFTPDQYPQEMEYYMKGLEVPVDALMNPMDLLSYPGQWLSYSKQMQKRRLCARLTNFIHLIDYKAQATCHKLYKNSVFAFVTEIEARIQSVPEEYVVPSKYHKRYEAMREKNEKFYPPVVVGDPEPMFDIGCSWDETELIFSPTPEDFMRSVRHLLGSWEREIELYDNMLPRDEFNPYTQVIVNGYMDQKTCGDGPSLVLLLSVDSDLHEFREIIEAQLMHSFDVCRGYIEQFEHIRQFCAANDLTDIEKFRTIDDVQVFSKLLEKYQKQLDIVAGLEDHKNLGLFKVDNSILRSNAYPSIHRCLEVLKEVIPAFGGKCVRELTERMMTAIGILEKYPETADEYVDYLLYLDDIQEKMDDIEQDLDICSEIFDLLFYYDIPGNEEDIGGFSALIPMLSQLRGHIDRQLLNRDVLIQELIEQFRIAEEKILLDMADIQLIAEAAEVLDPKTPAQPMCDKLTECRDILLAHQERASKFNTYQKQLKLDVTNFDELDKLLIEVKLRHQLWDSVTSWEAKRHEWNISQFNKLDQEEMTRDVNYFVKSVQQLEKGLPPNEVVPILKEKVEAMRAQLPLIGNLQNPNMKRRHWDVLEKAMNRTLTDESVTLKSLNEETGVQNYAELIAEISSQASAEASLEVLLKKVEDSWKDVEFLVLPYKDHRDNYILGGTDEIQVLLDDSHIHMATIASSRHVGPIKSKVDEWVRLLDLFTKTLDEWLICQRNYIYLEAIFCAPDIQRQLPNESKLFQQVDKNWRDIMQRTNRMPAALRAATQTGLLEQIQLSNEILDQIMKCLDDYLESKRVIFPRFYFLSNEELLEILAQTRNPQAVQPHLRKCFDAIQRIEFGGPANAIALDVLAMWSPEDERVSLTKGLKARGNVEDWLGKVEDAMFNSLKRIMRNALADYHIFPREEWLQKFPSQCVLTISQLMWAQMVHEILDAPGNKIQGMRDFEVKNFESLNKLAAMVRGQLGPLVRAVLCALITIDVHARDIVTSMVAKRVDTSTNFEWLKQLRYYWESSQEVVVARMANAEYFYGYEYLGASPRLVITPLTDRCYLCLMGALQLDLGGAPAGPAGTGKTETTKDLAKSLAFMCVVFNCSEGLDYKMMGRFFAGLAQSGGWCCFDEFNRIDIEVLSVIAQQLITIRLAKVHKLARFLFEGREIKLVKTCAAFITMNPGYAGRTELPDNLKALFRPISMMVPDYTLIAEVILYSEGFESSKSLANKMTNLYKLCSEQLSQQDHYDFGMRAVKSVLVMAGSLKRAHPDINENIVLIRALRDSNLPKFLAHDAILLHGIIQDLFPGVVIPEQDYGVLEKEAVKCSKDKGLQAPECFIRKVIQLYETLVVRHGVMLVGPTGGGKTTIYEVLKASLGSLYGNKIEGPMFKPVDTYVLNPKAVSLGELYGEVNPLTLEWRDGLLGIMVRTTVKPKATNPQWVVCDGPVDAIWIENMNTVLDDNKMLCLANSERIKLTNWVRMMFEVQDLAQASPATVSRCGMVYVDSKEMGWRPFVESWLHTLPSNAQEEAAGYLKKLFVNHLDAGFAFVQKNCEEMMPQSQMGKVSMMCSILEAMLTKKKLDYELERPKFLQLICQLFVFAYLWGVGGNIQEQYHEMFSNYIRSQFQSEEFSKLPKSGNLWQYYNNIETRKMDMWETMMTAYVYSETVPFVDILVPTVDTVRFGYLMELLLSVNRGVLFTGLTGTGKSAIAKYVLAQISSKNDYNPVFINFSAQTTSQRTQEMIEGKLERRKKTLMSAPMGKKVIVFIDDLNMPKLDRYGSQPALELLRQLMDFNGCYDRIKLFWKELQNVILMSACGPAGGGRNAVTPRLLRHFCMLAIPTPNNVVLRQIYRAIMRGFLQDFDVDVRDMADAIVNAAIDTYQFMVQTFLPTPSKSHYLFNMRDLSKCIQGVLQANYRAVVTKQNVVRLYYHECQRVFHDRLTNDRDKNIFCNSLAELCTRTLGVPTNAGEMKGIIFGDFMKMGLDRESRIYDEIPSKDKLKRVLSDYLDEYNIGTPKEMPLVFFTDAAENIARIARILRLDRGNALLVGVGGTGRQSLTRLSAHISGYKCFQIELMRGYDYNSFHDDLKKLYEIAGLNNQPVVFLFTDTQIAYEEFLEDINNILNSGEVPNLLEAEDLERLMAGVRGSAKSLGIDPENRDVHYDYFIRRIRSNLHIVLAMSPVGDDFRVRCRMFPSLVNCCTINWFTEWPTEALLSVAKNFMSKIELGKGVSVDAMADISVLVHESVTKMSERYYAEMRRRNYTTPSSYLELINLYTTMLSERREKIHSGKARIQNGLTKLLETNMLVKDMRVELSQLEPILVKKSDAVATLMVTLAEDQAAADVVRTMVKAEEEVAKGKALETQVIAEDAQKDLAEVLPALEAAVKALDALDKNDIAEIRVYQKPPEAVRTVMEAVCILFNNKTDWNSAKILLTDANFLKKLYDYDKDNVQEAMIKKLKPYIDNPKFEPKIVEKVSKACRSICMWVRAIDLYAKAFKIVEPKRNRYLAAQADLDALMETLRKKQMELNEVEKKITKLQQTYQNNVDEKKKLEDTMELTAARLHRAGKLTSALASEQTRWMESVKKFDEEMQNIIGDVFVSAACIAYFGAFTSFYRQILVTGWVKRCVDLKVPVNPKFTLVSFADPFEVRVWNSKGLPRDNTSTENAILATRARRWPLMIDPQDQANRWIKQLEGAKHLKVLKQSDSTFMRTLENCVRLGNPALLEEVGDTLDPSLESILLKQIFKQAGRTMIRLGDTNVDYDTNFRLYMTTKLANPHYLPEVCIKVTIINFTVTMSGLEEQLLSEVVGLERPELETQRQALVTQINADKNQLISLETKILRLLFQSEGNILDDEELILALNESKDTSKVITKRLAEAEITEEKISGAREKYRPIASRGSVLYFVVAQLSELDPMYQYSLKYFAQVFNHCIKTSHKTEELEERLRILKKETTLATYTNISRGLFEKDKVVFSFILCTDVMRSQGVLSDEEWNFFLRGGGTNVESGRTTKPPNASWLTQIQWNSICDLQNTFKHMKELSTSCLTEVVKLQIGDFRTSMFTRPGEKLRINDKWDRSLSRFQKLMLIKYLEEEKLVDAITEFVRHELGQKFIESPAIDLNEIYKDLNNATPLVFVLSVGSDPMASFYKFASEHNFAERVSSISLGQGQGPVAEALIKSATFHGDWVFLQNCHLASSWMPTLERIVKRINENAADVHHTFRLFLSSMPTDSFPVSILQDSVKITNEPPKGIRANVRRALLEMDKEFFEDNVLQMTWQRILFGICMFHAVIQERKKFGPLGWNIKYEFNDSDRQCCFLNLEMFCKGGEIPWDALEYITGLITYGGRITDNWDQRCLTTILKTYFSKKTLSRSHKYSPSGLYYAPQYKTLAQFSDYAEKLPITDDPEIFGMHDNANITFQQQESSALLNSILAVQPRQTGGRAGSANDEIAYELASSIEQKIPSRIDTDRANPKLFQKDSKGRSSSMGVFLLQEVDRFNKLLKVLKTTLEQLKKGIKGLVVMSEDLEKMYHSFLNNQVPDSWTRAGYGSTKPLSSWVKDLILRVGFINTWQTGANPPSSFWLSGFFFQQGFLTAVLQTFARTYGLPIDQLKFHYQVTRVVKEQTAQPVHGVENLLARPKDGVLVHGLFLEAARWNMNEMVLGDSKPGEMHPMLPVIHFQPSKAPIPEKFVYNCPLYKTPIRAGVLSTTGHSTNFIVPIELPTKVHQDYWILKGTALLSQLSD